MQLKSQGSFCKLPETGNS